MTLADTIVSSLTAETWSTIAKPTLTTQHDQQAELKTGTGWVSSGRETPNYETLGSAYGPSETPFEIYIACASDANNVLYTSNITNFINNKSVTGGIWEITEFFSDNLRNRHDFHCAGCQILLK